MSEENDTIEGDPLWSQLERMREATGKAQQRVDNLVIELREGYQDAWRELYDYHYEVEAGTRDPDPKELKRRADATTTAEVDPKMLEARRDAAEHRAGEAKLRERQFVIEHAEELVAELFEASFAAGERLRQALLEVYEAAGAWGEAYLRWESVRGDSPEQGIVFPAGDKPSNPMRWLGGDWDRLIGYARREPAHFIPAPKSLLAEALASRGEEMPERMFPNSAADAGIAVPDPQVPQSDLSAPDGPALLRSAYASSDQEDQAA